MKPKLTTILIIFSLLLGQSGVGYTLAPRAVGERDTVLIIDLKERFRAIPSFAERFNLLLDMCSSESMSQFARDLKRIGGRPAYMSPSRMRTWQKKGCVSPKNLKYVLATFIDIEYLGSHFSGITKEDVHELLRPDGGYYLDLNSLREVFRRVPLVSYRLQLLLKICGVTPERFAKDVIKLTSSTKKISKVTIDDLCYGKTNQVVHGYHDCIAEIFMHDLYLGCRMPGITEEIVLELLRPNGEFFVDGAGLISVCQNRTMRFRGSFSLLLKAVGIMTLAEFIKRVNKLKSLETKLEEGALNTMLDKGKITEAWLPHILDVLEPRLENRILANARDTLLDSLNPEVSIPAEQDQVFLKLAIDVDIVKNLFMKLPMLDARLLALLVLSGKSYKDFTSDLQDAIDSSEPITKYTVIGWKKQIPDEYWEAVIDLFLSKDYLENVILGITVSDVKRFLMPYDDYVSGEAFAEYEIIYAGGGSTDYVERSP